MGDASSTPPRHRSVWFVAPAAALVLALGVTVGIALDNGHATRHPTARTSDVPAAAPVAYCSAARDALMYEGVDTHRRDALLDRTIAVAPAEVSPSIREVRRASPGSTQLRKAKSLWDYYDNNHCCQCLGSREAPTIQALTPSQIKQIESGRPLKFKPARS